MTISELKNIVSELSKETKEQEWFEFKLNNKLDNQIIGEYISALSNSACLQNKDFGYLIWGVNDKTHQIEGTKVSLKNKKVGNIELEFWLNLNLNPKIDFSIHEFEYEPNKKICLIKLPAAINQPTKFKGKDYIRIDSNKTELKNYPDKERRIWNSSVDWSEQIIENLTVSDLDIEAIKLARLNYKRHNESKSFFKDIDNWSIETFLDKAKLTTNGKITKASIILLGKSELKRFINNNLLIVWIYIDEKGIKRHSEIFEPPFLLAVNDVLSKIRNDKIKILSDKSLIPIERTKYDTWIIREALNNCIAHQNYNKESRIIVTEKLDEVKFYNAGEFFQGTIEDYVLNDFTPPRYRNLFLVNAMVNIGMIETIGSGIKKMYNLQQERCFPLPDYFLSNDVELTIYGNIIDRDYTNKLIEDKNIDLGTVFLLDKIQKGYPISENDYKYMIIHFIKKLKKTDRESINKLMFGIFDKTLTDKQKQDKVKNLLYKLSKDGKIKNISGSRKKSIWVLSN